MRIGTVGADQIGIMIVRSVLSTAFLLGIAFFAADAASIGPTQNGSARCGGDNGGLTLAPGFCASIFADKLGHVRHMIVAADGTLYANTWSGDYYPGAPPPAGGYLLALRDTKNAGKADFIRRFGNTPKNGGKGGTGIYLYNGDLYAEEGQQILRYVLPVGTAVPAGKPQVVVTGLPITGDHPMHPFIIDRKGNLFVDLGTETNSCQKANRIPKSPGINPCIEKLTRGGTWRFDANGTNQMFSPSQRYASGIRNGEGYAFDKAGDLFVTQHGRDQLFQNWPAFYNANQSAELPAEELLLLKRGADYGWPECYFDQLQGKLVLAPEYGGDGGKTVGVCAKRTPPVAAFPGHWGPDDLAIYRGSKFPFGYRDGAFIAFHGSWNRAPRPQAGYTIVFQPLKDGKAAGHYVVFANGFAGGHIDPDEAAFRPAGLAEAPDGSLYVSDDIHGRIWKITYKGSGNDAVANAPEVTILATTDRSTVPLPVPPGATADQVALGKSIFHGGIEDGTCSGCHGVNAGGSQQGPPLNKGSWLWSDGSLAGLTKTIREGVPHPKKYQGVMPPLGGAPLSSSDLSAVAAYVWAVGHANKQ
jgi:glucose/arabinose dehydrogenase/mono/diheme cytochrome c family protein